MSAPKVTVPEGLAAHLRSWVGAWPPEDPPLLVAHPAAAERTWDGNVRPVRGVVDEAGRAVVGVAPELAAAVHGSDGASEALGDVDRLRDLLPALLGRPDHVVYRAVFRWCTEPAALPDAGAWESAGAQHTPDWLRPFGGQVLVARDDDGTYLAGVGIKRHDRWGHELAVVTAEHARGNGLARRLVAQAARRVLESGRIPTYLHAPSNTASARVAEAAGFPDHGWSALGLSDRPVPRA